MAKKKSPSGESYHMNEGANKLPDHLDPEKVLRADAQENREQILQTACKLFAEKGLVVPISTIAREAGIGVGTVYRHFPTKEALFNAINVGYKQKFIEEARALINAADPGKAFFDFFFHVMEECFTNRALRDSFRIGAIRLRKATSGVWLDFQLACADLLTQAQHAKAVREDIDIMDLFVFMSGLLTVADEPDDVSNQSRFNQWMSIVRDGLGYQST